MKTPYILNFANKIFRKIAFTFLLSLSLATNSFGANEISVTLTSCIATPTTIEFDIFIRNQSSLPMILQFGSYGIDWDYTAIGGGDPTNITINYVPNSSELATLQSDFENSNTFIEDNVPTASPTYSIRILPQIVTSTGSGTSLPIGLDVRVGTFRLTNTTGNWTLDSRPQFTWVTALVAGKTRTAFTAYVNGNTTPVNLIISPAPIIEVICDTMVLKNTIGIDKIDNENQLLLFPNPIESVLHVKKMNSDVINEIKIINSNGQVMRIDYSSMKNNESVEINTSSLAKGIYIVQMVCDKKIFTKKFIKA